MWWDEMKLDDLTDINMRINEDSTYVSDPAQYGKLDQWADIRTTKQGDCEDYAIGKLRALLAIGWPISALRLATCYVEPFRIDGRDVPKNERYHGVLLADFEGQTWCLDNRKPYPTEWQNTGYEFDLLQIAGQPFMEKV